MNIIMVILVIIVIVLLELVRIRGARPRLAEAFPFGD